MRSDPNDDLPDQPWESGNPSDAIATALTLLRALVVTQRLVVDSLERIENEIFLQNRT